MTGETIRTSLQIIKNVCEAHIKDCNKCPFEVGGVCGICDLEPHNWKINKHTKYQALE